jgi:hypothetical protein
VLSIHDQAGPPPEDWFSSRSGRTMAGR